MKNWLILAVLFVLPTFIWSQEDLTLEESYLSQARLQREMQLDIVQNQAHSDELEQKMASVRGIERIIDQGDLLPSDREALASLLGDLGLLGTAILAQREGEIQQNQDRLRSESARVLGKLGQNEAARVLESMLVHDLSPIVLSQCAISTAQVIPTLDSQEDQGLDRQLVQVLADTMKGQKIREESGHFALAFLDAVSMIGSHNPNLLNNSLLLEELTKLTQMTGVYPRRVRDRAWEVLEEIQGY